MQTYVVVILALRLCGLMRKTVEDIDNRALLKYPIAVFTGRFSGILADAAAIYLLWPWSI